MSDSVRDRIAQVLIRDAFGMTTRTAAYRQADAVIAELDIANLCAEMGCRMRRMARRHADLSSRLEATTDE